MAEENVYFVGGLAVESDYVHVIAYLHEFDLDPTEYSRIYFYDNGEWTSDECQYQIVSMARMVTDGTPTYYYLGRRGEVVVLDGTERREERIKGAGTGAGTYGYVSEIREIDGNLYACGANRQVYRRFSDGWRPIHDQILHGKPHTVEFSFKSIDGTAESNIFAVGFEGEIFHYDGNVWTQVDSPTNIHLHRVLCIDEDLVYVCGDDGTVIRGEKGKWQLVDSEDVTENFWGLCVYNDDVYVSSVTSLYKLTKSGLSEIKVPLRPKTHWGQLYTSDDVLWSMGSHDIVRFDGKKWRRIVCPDNA